MGVRADCTSRTSRNERHFPESLRVNLTRGVLASKFGSSPKEPNSMPGNSKFAMLNGTEVRT